MHYTVSDNKNTLLFSISELYLNNERIHLDLCFNVGGFYADICSLIESPELINDINLGTDLELKKPETSILTSIYRVNNYSPGRSRLTAFDCRHTNLAAGSIRSIIFDPPFLIGNNPMTERYGGFGSARELWKFQVDSLREIARILKPGGILITKIQDFTHGSQKYFPSIFQINRAMDFELYLLDSFILINKNRMRAKTSGSRSAVSAHCFFNVFQKGTRKKRVDRY